MCHRIKSYQTLKFRLCPSCRYCVQSLCGWTDANYFYSSSSRETNRRERARLAAGLQKEQRLESLSRMAGGVTHDFNNALMVITGIGDDLLTTATPNDRMCQRKRCCLCLDTCLI